MRESKFAGTAGVGMGVFAAQSVGVFHDREDTSSGYGENSNLLDIVPQREGSRLGTFRGGAIHCIRPPNSEVLITKAHYSTVTLQPVLGMQASFGNHRMQRFNAEIGALDIIPANTESCWQWGTNAEYMMVGFSHSSLLALAASELDKDSADLQPIPFGTVDQRALRLAQMLKGELTESDAPNELYADSLITLFGIHLLRTYGARSPVRRPVRGGLAATKARQVQEFLHENLSCKISVADLAAVCGLSGGHFIAAFTQTFRQSPHQYLLHLRLSCAERLLVETTLPVTEVACLSGFSSQSHLTSAFRRNKNLTPMQIRTRRSGCLS